MKTLARLFPSFLLKLILLADNAQQALRRFIKTADEALWQRLGPDPKPGDRDYLSDEEVHERYRQLMERIRSEESEP